MSDLPLVKTDAAPAAKPWCLYLLRCRNGSFYAGITNDLQARFAAHLAGKGARYTRANPPTGIVASCPFPDRASASRAEWHLKQLPRQAKKSYVEDCRARAMAC